MEVAEHRVEVEPGVRLAAWVADGRSARREPDDPEPVALLFVHGLASNAKLWDVTSLELASRGNLVAAVDLRGHGMSDKPDTGYDFARMVADLQKVLDELGLERPILGGQSMGANLVLEMAWRHPESVTGVVCVDGGTIELSRGFPDCDDAASALAPPPLVGTQETAMRAMLLRSHPSWPQTGIESTMANFCLRADGTIAPNLSRGNHMLILRSLWEDRPTEKFATIRVPALFVFAGASGPPDKRKGAAAAKARIGRVEVVWFDDADHDIHAQYPVELAELLEDRIRRGFFTSSDILAGD